MAAPVQIDGQGDVLDFVPVLDTSIYADGDVLWVTKELPAAVRVDGGRAWLTGLLALDVDDEGAAFDILVLDSNVSIGTLNAAVSISDADATKIIARVQVGAGDFYDLGGCRVADVRFAPPIELKAVAGAGQPNRSLWLGGVSRGTGTYSAASDLKIKLRMAWD